MANNTASSSFILNGDQAINELNKLQSEAKELNTQFSKLKRGTEEYVQAANKIKENNAAITAYQKQLGVTGQTINQLKYQQQQLRQEIGKLVPGTDEYIQKTKEYSKVTGRIGELKQGITDLGTKNKTVFEQMGISAQVAGGLIIAAVTAIVAGLVNMYSKAISVSAKTSDAFADIQKSTGQTNEEVQALADNLDKLDTRTSFANLLDIAKVGGQIGIAKDEMEGFVASVDKAVVALGDEFTGGAEEVAKSMGTLKNLFAETKELDAGDAISRIGSAVNQLGSEGLAQGPAISDFAARIGQLGSIGPNLTDTLGLASVLTGELGLSSEIAAGGLTNVLLEMGKSSEKFANFMGIAKEDFEKAFNEDSNKVLLEFSERFKGLEDTDILNVLKELGINSQEANKVFGGLSKNLDKVKDSQRSASQAFKDNISLTNEFNIKNQTQQASIEKSTKLWDQFYRNQGQKAGGFYTILLSNTPTIIKLTESFLTVLDKIGGTLYKAFKPLFTIFSDIQKAFKDSGAEVDILSAIINAMFITVKLGFQGFSLLLQPLIGGFSALSKLITSGPTAAVNSLIDTAQIMKSVFMDILDTLTLGFFNLGSEVESTGEKVGSAAGGAKGQGQQQESNSIFSKVAGDIKNKVDSFESPEEIKAKEEQARLDAENKANAQKFIQEQDKEGKNTLLKQQEEYAKKVEASEKTLQDLKVSLIKDETERKIAEIRLSADREMKEFQGTEAQKTEFEKLITQQRDDEISAIKIGNMWDNLEKQKELSEQALKDKIEGIDAEYEAQTAQEEINYLGQQEYLDELKGENFDAFYEAEAEREQALFDLKQSFMQQKIDALMTGNEQDRAEGVKLGLEKVKNEAEFNAQRVRNEKLTEEQRKKLGREGWQAAKGLLADTIGLLEADENARSEYSGAIKALKVADIAISLQGEIAGIWEYAQKNPINALIPGWGTGFAIFQTALSVARAGMATNKVLSAEKGGIFSDYVRSVGTNAVMQYAGGGMVRNAGVLSGARHSQGGLSVFDNRSGRQVAEFEGGEPVMVLSRDTYSNNRDIVDQLLHTSLNAGGARIGRFEKGGTIGLGSQATANVQNSQISNPDLNDAIQTLLNNQTLLVNEIRTNKDMFKKVFVLLDDIEGANSTKQNIKNFNNI